MAFRRAGAEFVGTFVLVFGGVGSAVLAGQAIGVLGVALAFGLSLLVMAYAVGPVSGCHINPAVTLGLLVRGKIGPSEAARYWAAQVLGAIAAAGILLAIVASRDAGYDVGNDGLGANGYGAHSPGGYPWGAAFAVEVLLTGLLVFAVLATTDRIAAVAFAGIPIGARARSHPPRRDPGRQHLGQSSAQHRARDLRRRLGSRAALALHRRPTRRRAAGRGSARGVIRRH